MDVRVGRTSDEQHRSIGKMEFESEGPYVAEVQTYAQNVSYAEWSPISWINWMNENPSTVLDVSSVEALANSYKGGMRIVSNWSLLNKRQKEKAMKQKKLASTAFEQPPVRLLLAELAKNLADKEAELQIDSEVTKNAVTIAKASGKRLLQFLDTAAKKIKPTHPPVSMPSTPPRGAVGLAEVTPKKPFMLGGTSPKSIVSSEGVEIECETTSTVQKRLRAGIQAKAAESDPWIFGAVNLHKKMKTMQKTLLKEMTDKNLEVPFDSLPFLTSSSVVVLSEALPHEYQSVWTETEWRTLRAAFDERRISIDSKLWPFCLSEAESLIKAKLAGRGYYAHVPQEKSLEDCQVAGVLNNLFLLLDTAKPAITEHEPTWSSKLLHPYFLMTPTELNWSYDNRTQKNPKRPDYRIYDTSDRSIAMFEVKTDFVSITK
ncbi:hypothetical protein DFS34DRAFT_171300 [Phlyctochytrium arcticum]|nr:hypothetical protein DFS34DRAFT_171300 [Phlyctochytrium arcticum]